MVIDLGSVQHISCVATNFLQVSGPEIFLPEEYTISISTDGTKFEEIHHRTHAVEKLVNPSVERWEWNGSAHARYIRLKTKPGPFGGWIFTDEIEVY